MHARIPVEIIYAENKARESAGGVSHGENFLFFHTIQIYLNQFAEISHCRA
jgi:hypothetical protein